VTATVTVAPGTSADVDAYVHCSGADYATGGAVSPQEGGAVVRGSYPVLFSGGSYSAISSGRPNAWFWEVASTVAPQDDFCNTTYVVCQTPFAVAGVTVPEFGSLYAAIALGAGVHFMLARHHTSRPAVSARVQAQQSDRRAEILEGDGCPEKAPSDTGETQEQIGCQPCGDESCIRVLLTLRLTPSVSQLAGIDSED